MCPPFAVQGKEPRVEANAACGLAAAADDGCLEPSHRCGAPAPIQSGCGVRARGDGCAVTRRPRPSPRLGSSGALERHATWRRRFPRTQSSSRCRHPGSADEASGAIARPVGGNPGRCRSAAALPLARVGPERRRLVGGAPAVKARAPRRSSIPLAAARRASGHAWPRRRSAEAKARASVVDVRFLSCRTSASAGLTRTTASQRLSPPTAGAPARAARVLRRSGRRQARPCRGRSR